MKDLAISRAIRDRLKTEFPDIYVGSPVDGESIVMPAILLDIESKSSVGSPLYRGTLSVSVNSLAETTGEEDHRQLCEAVDASVRQMTGYGGYGAILDGVVATNVRQHPVDQHWSSMMEYIIGFH
jgi:hypothetical protein